MKGSFSSTLIHRKWAFSLLCLCIFANYTFSMSKYVEHASASSQTPIKNFCLYFQAPNKNLLSKHLPFTIVEWWDRNKDNTERTHTHTHQKSQWWINSISNSSSIITFTINYVCALLSIYKHAMRFRTLIEYTKMSQRITTFRYKNERIFVEQSLV